MRLESLTSGIRLNGVEPGETVTVLFAQPHGADAVELAYKRVNGSLGQRLVFRDDEDSLTVANTGARAFDAPAEDFKLAAEAKRIQLAGLFDPMLAVATSNVRPLPHQISAVYRELLPRTPLRFLLADDPGAGKTIMAGLYVKELVLRDDVQRCLIVAPGGLVEQWQDELFFKFGLNFDLLTNQLIDANVNVNVFETKNLVIARMDQLARNEELQRRLMESRWDLVVVDEAHRMGANWFGGELRKTKRFLLGEKLGEIARHLLLMTATPHSGKEEDFQAFLTLLDRDRFAGQKKTSVDTAGLMRRMVKEDLLTFEGKRLFPERVAETVPYALTSLEQELYEDVTEYVRTGMNRAERLDGKRRNTVGFAMTVLQRRLASSPGAIYKSLVRRAERLERKKREIEEGLFAEPLPNVDLTNLDDDELSAEELEFLEEEVMDAATAAQTVAELGAELKELDVLISAASQVCASGTDRKWSELSRILHDHTLTTDAKGLPRKLIIFTEHRDTLDYLRGRVTALLGRPEAVVAIHGGVRRLDRRRITEEFTKNPGCQVLLATDAAGEGLNLQAAHLMVNYDLPWNPNRIEQRFGRVHRIGQTEVCRLWNLVATNTREGEVFTTLLWKLEQMSESYGGKVFDVLGEAFAETPLRDLLLRAIQYGEQPEVRARMHEVIDEAAGKRVRHLLTERALAATGFSEDDLQTMRAAMDEARAKRLQPHYIEMAFKVAFARLGGKIVRREKGRFEITHVPATVRAQAHAPVASQYERVCFALDHIGDEETIRADLLAPGHPLHDAVMDLATKQFSGSLNAGTVLVSATLEKPHLLVGVEETVNDGTGASVARRFGYVFVDEHGTVASAGPAPYLDCVAAPHGHKVDQARSAAWLTDAETKALSWISAHRLREYLDEVRPARAAELERARGQVRERLVAERERLLRDASAAQEKQRRGEKVKETAASLTSKATDLGVRLIKRMELLDRQSHMSTQPPRFVTAALVLPLSAVADEIDRNAPLHAKETKEVERRGINLVLATERNLGRAAEEQAFTNPGFDVLSAAPDGTTVRIEVKARKAGAEDFFVTHNEVMTGKNAAPHYRLALVSVDPRGPEHDQVRYIADPFRTTDLGGFSATGVRGDWAQSWAKAATPF